MSDSIRHTPEDIVISPDNPFGTDCLGRKKFAEFLTVIVEKYSKGFVMAINGAWGTGKTVFMRQWLELLKQRGFKATLFNAWENDYFGEPTLAILSQFRYFINKDSTLSENLYSCWKSIQKAPLIAIRGFMKKQLSDVIGEEAVKEISRAYTNSSEANEEFRKGDIVKYVDQQIKLTNYKNSLEEFAKELSSTGKPLVFIIDELDRCKPSYAVEVLEKVKHLFNLENIVFCISIDKEQLKKSIKGYYGSYDFNGDEYLRRFFDIQFELPPIKHHEFANLMVEHFELDSLLIQNLKDFVDISSDLAEYLNISLRQYEKFFAHAKLIFSYYVNEKREYLMAIMLFLYLFKPDIFDEIRYRKLSLEDYARSLKSLSDVTKFQKTFGVLGSLLYHIDVYLRPDKIHVVNNDFEFDFVDKSLFTEDELTCLTNYYISESHNRLSYKNVLKNVISQITFIDTLISKNF